MFDSRDDIEMLGADSYVDKDTWDCFNRAVRNYNLQLRLKRRVPTLKSRKKKKKYVAQDGNVRCILIDTHT